MHSIYLTCVQKSNLSSKIGSFADWKEVSLDFLHVRLLEVQRCKASYLLSLKTPFTHVQVVHAIPLGNNYQLADVPRKCSVV